jgi:hypothetical protein
LLTVWRLFVPTRLVRISGVEVYMATSIQRISWAEGIRTRHDYQAYKLLHVAFTIAPILAGLDKFFDLMTNWNKYLAPWAARLSPISAHSLMMIIGVVEIIAGIVVAIRPRVGAYIVTAWLWLIIINLLLYPGYFDIALRDFGLSLGALALGCLSIEFDRRK